MERRYRYVGETEEEKVKCNMKQNMERDMKILSDTMHDSIGRYQQCQTLYCTFQSDSSHQTASIKEFFRRMEKFMKDFSSHLHLKLIAQKKREMYKIYTYENFSVIYVISYTKEGHLCSHCLFMRGNRVNLDYLTINTAIKYCWDYGETSVQYFLCDLPKDSEERIVNDFCSKYMAIRKLRMLDSWQIREYAERITEEHIVERKLEEIAIENKDQLVQECYNNLCDLNEQQAKGKKNCVNYQRKAKCL
jgi:hypothetical protein